MKKLILEDQGSLTLEATIVLPVFLAIVLFLINVVNVAMVYIAMDHAVSEITKQFATRAYPLKYLNSGTSVGNPEDKLSQVINSLNSLNSGQSTPERLIASEIVNQLGDCIEGESAGAAINRIVKVIAEKKITEIYPLVNIADRGVVVCQVKMYNPYQTSGNFGTLNNIGLSGKDVVISVRYKVKLAVPFLPLKEIIMSNTAAERAWVEN